MSDPSKPGVGLPPKKRMRHDRHFVDELAPRMGEGIGRMVRITATEPNTTLTYDPPQNGAPGMIAAAGGKPDAVSGEGRSPDLGFEVGCRCGDQFGRCGVPQPGFAFVGGRKD